MCKFILLNLRPLLIYVYPVLERFDLDISLKIYTINIQ